MKPSKKFMRLAIASARKGVRSGQSPFGAVIAKGDKVLAVSHNLVLRKHDATAHAEINAIHAACGKLKSWDLSGCVIYSTFEPCPMCFSAIHWAGIGEIVYGASIADAKECGFRELEIPDALMNRISRAKIRITNGFLLGECVRLMKSWAKRKNRRTY